MTRTRDTYVIARWRFLRMAGTPLQILTNLGGSLVMKPPYAHDPQQRFSCFGSLETLRSFAARFTSGVLLMLGLCFPFQSAWSGIENGSLTVTVNGRISESPPPADEPYDVTVNWSYT